MPLNTDYTDRYIAFLDIIGFKDLIEHSECSDILNIYDKINLNDFLSSISGNIAFDSIQLPSSIVPSWSINYKIMSDSICIYIDANVKNALIELIAVCTNFQARMLNLDVPILVRGAIVRGELYANGDVMFGKGLTKAYQLEEKIAKVPRIIIPTELIDTYNDCDEQFSKLKNILTYKEEDYFYIIQFFLFYTMIARSDVSCDRVLKLSDYVNHQLNIYFEPSIREKYLYLQKWLKGYKPGENKT